MSVSERGRGAPYGPATRPDQFTVAEVRMQPCGRYTTSRLGNVETAGL